MPLWLEWFRCVLDLRPACARTATFLWMSLALMGLAVRAELAGVTSFVRALGLAPAKPCIGNREDQQTELR